MFRTHILGSLLLATALAASSLMAASGSGEVQSGQAAIASIRKEVKLIEPPVVPLTEKFNEAVDRWIRELAKQPEFVDWTKATWRREPLGPGLHGWIVLLERGGKEVGYLVIGAKPDGQFILVEYGAGEYPLFSINTLYRSLVRQELIPSSMTVEQFLLREDVSAERHYFGPFETVWAVTIGHDQAWLDAKTGEALPLDTAILQLAANETAQRFDADIPQDGEPAEAAVVRSLTTPDFDPYYHLGWLSKPGAPLQSLQQVQHELAASRLVTYVTELYGDNVIYAVATTGYQEWQSLGTYIRLDHIGTRYIPAQLLLAEGEFHQIPSPSYS